MENEDVFEKKVEQVLTELLDAIRVAAKSDSLDCVNTYSQAFQRILTGVKA